MTAIFASTPIIPVGQILLSQELIDQAMLDEALAIQKTTHERVGRILLTQGHVSILRLYTAIAQHYRLPFVNLHHTPADSTLQRKEDCNDYIRFKAAPFTKKNNTVVLATSDPSEALMQWAQQRYGDNVDFVITSPYDIYWHIDTHFSEQLDTHSRLNLKNIMPHKSASSVITLSQKLWLAAFVFSFIVAFMYYPIITMLGAFLSLNIFYFSTILLKCQLFLLGKSYHPGKYITADALPTSEVSLPIYTVLIPLHDEAETLPRLLQALDALDYPKSKLDIKLIVEREDYKTIHAIKKLKPHSGYEIIHVPYSLPQTKPKACNYALHFARGKYVTIYDAEDIPDPQQLKKAVYWFSKQPPHVICLQARLNYYNRNHSLLTRLFAIEYAAWFDFMLPGLRRMNIPIPLGGTSNHIHLQKLREIGEWDPYNVTEDADLGIRLALQHYETDMLDSLTAEEAPIKLNVWMNQRVRWIRGYMQTWLVHMRHPLQLMRELDFTAFWGFQFFIGGPCLVFLSAPILWILSGLWFFGAIEFHHPKLVQWVYVISLANLLFGSITHLVFASVIIRRYGWKDMTLALFAFPVYWLLHSAASFKALWQLMVNPHIWEKTPHGQSTISEDEKATVLQHMH
ncbi:MAG: glycosyltransferase [Alphaproteobacteria bacterium]|nr:glycosyltransferase [Alphaproteobacteria bacterium]